MYLVGVDLGQANDSTAIAILQKVQLYKPYPFEKEKNGLPEYHLLHLERPALGTPYPEIVRRVKQLMTDDRMEGPTSLIVDATGVGRPVVDMFTEAKLSPVAISITGGNTANRVPGGFNVPKRDLVTNLLTLFQTERLRVPNGIRNGETFIHELLGFRIKINVNTGHDSYEAHREGIHDDIVLAVAIAAWYGCKGYGELRAVERF